MFTPRPSILIYILRNQLIFYDKRGGARQFDIPTGLVENLEVLDSDRYKEACNGFLQEAQLGKQRALLLLADGIVFRKAISAKDRGASQADMEAFTAMIPLEPDQQRVIAYEKQGNLLLFGTNRDLYQPITEALIDQGSKVLACVPAAAYNLLANQKPDQTLRAYFFNKFNSSRSPDFLTIR